MNGTLPRRVTSEQRNLKARRYAHFDDPIDSVALASFRIEPAEVERHSFLPLLGYTKIIRRMDFSGDFPALAPKPREIRYASHKDAAIYSLYARELSELYDESLRLRDLNGVVLAYRSGIGNNISFAKGLFDEVKDRGECVVICLDISGFFDHLKHDILERSLCNILRKSALRKDWLKIFMRLTRYEYIAKEDLRSVLGRPNRKRLCDINTFRRVVRPLIRRHLNDHGIPQGTPLSGLFANLYMLDFDVKLHERIRTNGGSYRRYSDDIAIVLPNPSDVDDLIRSVTQELGDLGLKINENKSCLSVISKYGEIQSITGHELQYLGFTFDGRHILIRSASIKNFYARMKRGIRRYVKGAQKKGVAVSDIRKRVPIGRFTHWGDDRNFVQYAYRAARIMNSPEMKRQLRNHVRIFDTQWAKTVARFYAS